MESDDQLAQYGTPQHSNSFKRPRRSLQSSTPLSSVSESASPSPRLSGQAQLTPEIIDHINGLKHLDDKQIFLLLEAARNGGGSYSCRPCRPWSLIAYQIVCALLVQTGPQSPLLEAEPLPT